MVQHREQAERCHNVPVQFCRDHFCLYPCLLHTTRNISRRPTVQLHISWPCRRSHGPAVHALLMRLISHSEAPSTYHRGGHNAIPRAYERAMVVVGSTPTTPLHRVREEPAVRRSPSFLQTAVALLRSPELTLGISRLLPLARMLRAPATPQQTPCVHVGKK